MDIYFQQDGFPYTNQISSQTKELSGDCEWAGGCCSKEEKFGSTESN